MKFKKLVMECGIMAVAAAVVTIPSAVSVSAAGTVSRKTTATVGKINTVDSKTADNLQETKSVEKSEWEDRLLVVVDEKSTLNIRSEANTESEIVGKMSRGAGADIIEVGEEWSKIESGNVTGYVKNEFCVFAAEAETKANEICETQATSTTDGLRIRKEASTESGILHVLNEGDSITVADGQTDAVNGWVQVEYKDTVAYVSADYVDVELNVGKAVSMEEIRKAEAAKRAAKAAQSGAGTIQNDAVSASSDETTLLAAIIMCEAGGEPYAGQVAVGAVVMNRVRSGSFPNSISGVIYQKGQFSPVASGKLSRVLSSGKISSSCFDAAREALAGADNTGGAKFFHAGSGKGLMIGNQVFY